MSEYPCDKCPLHLHANSILVPGKGSEDPDILFVGGAPGYTDDREGECFVGAPGKALMGLIRKAAIPMENIRFTYAVRCIPWTSTKTKSKTRSIEEKDTDACSPYLMEEIDTYKPKIIVPLGKPTTAYFLPHLGNKFSITRINGVAFTWEHPDTQEEYTVIPMINPAAMLRNSKAGKDIDKALNFIKEINSGKSTDIFDDCDYVYLDTEEKIKEYVDMVIARYHADPSDPYNVVSVDVETGFADPLPEDYEMTQKQIALSPYNPYNTVVSVQLSHKPKAGAFIPLWHEDSPFKSYSDIKMVAYHLQRLLDIVPAMGQNYKFDIQVLYVRLGVITRRVIFDSMLAHFLVFQKTQPLGLEDMAGKYVEMPMFKQEMDKALKSLPEAKRHMGYVDLDKLIRYGCGDADAVFRLYRYWRPVLEDEGMWETYETILADATASLSWIEISGMVIDPKRLEKLSVEFIEHLQQLKDKIASSYIIQDFNVLVREQYDRKIARQKEDKAFKRIEEGKKPMAPRRWKEEVLDKREAKLQETLAFNPGSPLQLRKLFYHRDLMGFDVANKTKTDKPSTDKKARRELLESAHTKIQKLIKLKSDEDEVGFYQDCVELIEDLSKWTGSNKLYSAYIKSAPKMIHDTGDIKHVWPIELPPEVARWSFHSNFKIIGTDTGRLSCSGPNIQQMPSGSDIKWMFVSRWASIGGMLLQADYSQAELRVLAIVANETAMLEAFERGEDIHMFVAKLVFGALGQTEITKDMRKIAKKASFGVVYGQGPKALAYEFGTTVEDAQDIINQLYTVFPNMQDWMDSKKAECRSDGYVTSPMGRIRWIDGSMDNNKYTRLEADRKAVNTPIQSAASDWTLCSLNEVSKRFREGGLRSLLVATIHDSIMVDVYPGEMLEVIRILKLEMVTNLPKRFSWMRGMEPKVDFEFGVDWKSMTDLEQNEDLTYKIKGKIENVKKSLVGLMEGGADVDQIDCFIDVDNPDESWALIDLEMEREYVSI